VSAQGLQALEDLAVKRGGFSLLGMPLTSAEARLGPLARREGYSSLTQLAEAASKAPGDRLAYEVVEALAPRQTRFFGGRETFRLLRETVLPEQAAKHPGEPVRVWCAGCASGQEAYSLAMMAEAMRSKGHDTRQEIVLGIGGTRALQAMNIQPSVYHMNEGHAAFLALDRIRMLVEHFEEDGDQWRISRALRNAVEFRTLNLLHDFSTLGRFDVILLRGVLGAMPGDIRKDVFTRVADRLAAGGALALGETERPPHGAAYATEGPGWILRAPEAEAA